MDEQTAMGKAPVGVAKLAKKHGCTVIAFAGALQEGFTVCHEIGIDAAILHSEKGSQPGRGDGSGRCDAKSDGYLQRGVPAGESCRGCFTMRQHSMSHIAGVVPQ